MRTRRPDLNRMPRRQEHQSAARLRVQACWPLRRQQDLQCPSEPCDRVGEGATRDGLEFAQAVMQAREFIRWLTGAGRTEGHDQETRESPETSSRRPSPPLGGSVSTEMVIQEQRRNPSGTGVAEHAPAVEDAPATVGFKSRNTIRSPNGRPLCLKKADCLRASRRFRKAFS